MQKFEKYSSIQMPRGLSHSPRTPDVLSLSGISKKSLLLYSSHSIYNILFYNLSGHNDLCTCFIPSVIGRGSLQARPVYLRSTWHRALLLAGAGSYL